MEKSTLHTKNINGNLITVPNKVTKETEKYYVSYNNRDLAIYGARTTALYINETGQFLILNDNHSKNYDELNTLKECVKYFYNNIEQANPKSEHGTIFKINENGKAGYIKGGY